MRRTVTPFSLDFTFDQLRLLGMPAANTNPTATDQQAQDIFALRDRLVKDVKQAKKGKVGSGSPATGQPVAE